MKKEILNGVPIPYDRSVEALRRQKFVLDRMVGICYKGISKNSSHDESMESFPSFVTKFLRRG